MEWMNNNSGTIQIIFGVIALILAYGSLRFAIWGFKKEREERGFERREREKERNEDLIERDKQREHEREKWIEDISERKKKREIEGKERIIHSFMSRYFTHINDSIPEVWHRKNTYALGHESIWSTLDDIYNNGHNDFVVARNDIDRLLSEWTNIGSLEKFRAIDSEIRDYYGLWAPPEIRR